ncbi:MAG: hypothetical protein FWF44_05915 [Defluviitaleaceae bacterium]|nr:hypothetical protein [Defluviitaleaceae bacterium]
MRKRRWYLESYEMRKGPDGKKEVIYTGKTYILPEDPARRRMAVFFPVTMGLAFAFGGFNDSVIGVTMYAMLPFMLAFLPLALTWMYCWPLARGKLSYTELRKEKITKRLRLATIFIFILSLASLAGALVCAVINRLSDWEDILFIFCCIYNAAASYLFMRAQRRHIADNFDEEFLSNGQ